MKFRYNHYCSCARCQAHGYMGPAVLITLGVLFLLDRTSGVSLDLRWVWPFLLIGLGIAGLMRSRAPR